MDGGSRVSSSAVAAAVLSAVRDREQLYAPSLLLISTVSLRTPLPSKLRVAASDKRVVGDLGAQRRVGNVQRGGEPRSGPVAVPWQPMGREAVTIARALTQSGRADRSCAIQKLSSTRSPAALPRCRDRPGRS